MNTLLRLGLIAALCALLAGCGAFMAGVLLSAEAQFKRKQEKACLALAGMNLVVSESSDLKIPADEGQVSTFEPATWHAEGALLASGSLEAALLAELGTKNLTAPIAGTLVISERFILLVPPQGTTGVRIPFTAIWYTDKRFNLMGEPRAVVIETCGGRLDIFTLVQKDDSRKPDPHANAQALDQINTRIEADPVRKELWQEFQLPWQFFQRH